MTEQEIKALQQENADLKKEIKALSTDKNSLTEENNSLKKQLADMQSETLTYQKDMQEKVASLTKKIAPEKNIIDVDGTQYELIGKSIMIPGKGKIDIEKLKEDKELKSLIIKKYPSMVKEIK